jgi:hypothetical protein
MRKRAHEPYRLSTKSKRERFFAERPLPHGIEAKNRVPDLVVKSHQIPKGGPLRFAHMAKALSDTPPSPNIIILKSF